MFFEHPKGDSMFRRGNRRSTFALHRSMLSSLERLESRLCMSVSYTAAEDQVVAGIADFVTAADFDNDGRQDLAVSSYDASKITILYGAGDGSFPLYDDITLASAPDFVTTGDVN